MITCRLFAAAFLASSFLAVPSVAQLDRLLVPITKDTPAPSAETKHNTVASPAAKTYTLGAEAFVAQLEKELGKRLTLDGDLKLTLAQPWKLTKLPADNFAVVVTETPKGGISGTFLVRAQIFSDGEAVEDLAVSLRAQLWQDVWTATNRLERGQTLDRSMLTTTKLDVLNERQPPLLANVDPSTLEMAQTVTSSHPLARRDVIERPLIRKGQVVDVVARRGQLAISMKALALESGAGGALIKLRNMESQKTFTAQILNDNKVQVHF